MKSVIIDGIVDEHFRELRNEFLAQMQLQNYALKTLDTYRYALDNFLSFLKQNGVETIQDVDTSLLDNYRTTIIKRKFKPSSVDVYLRMVRNFFAFLEESGIIFVSPATHLKRPHYERTLPPVLSVEEMETLLSQPEITTTTGIRNRAILETAYSTAVRLHELVNICINDIDFLNANLRVLGKGRKERILPLGKQALLWIENYLTNARDELLRGKIEEPRLWINIRSQPLTWSAVRVMLAGYVKKAEIKTHTTVHTIRRSCATHMLENGAHPAEIKELLGHANMKCLGQYLRITVAELKKIHCQSKLGE